MIKKIIIKKINKYRLFPILSICHGFENLLLIESNKKPTKKTIKKFFINTEAYFGYKTCPLYCNNNISKNLKKDKLTTRDSRVVERKKYGHRKARRSFQFSKR